MQTTVKTRLPSSFGHSDPSVSYSSENYSPFGGAKLSGIGNVTEFRIYGKEKGAFKGVYWGPYFNYMHYKLTTSKYPGNFKDANGVVYTADLQQVVKVNLAHGGLQVGLQTLIKDRVAIDWCILGIGFGSLSIRAGVDATNTSNNFDFNNYSDDVKKLKFAFSKIITLKKTIQAESISYGFKIPMIYFKTGLCVGIVY